MAFAEYAYNKFDHWLECELPTTGFEDDDISYEFIKKQAEAEAKEWRAAHPLEEKLRLAKLSGSCVDIAELISYWETHLIEQLKWGYSLTLEVVVCQTTTTVSVSFTKCS